MRQHGECHHGTDTTRRLRHPFRRLYGEQMVSVSQDTPLLEHL